MKMTQDLQVLAYLLTEEGHPIHQTDLDKLNSNERTIAMLLQAAYNKGFEDGEWAERYGNEEVDYIDY